MAQSATSLVRTSSRTSAAFASAVPGVLPSPSTKISNIPGASLQVEGVIAIDKGPGKGVKSLPFDKNVQKQMSAIQKLLKDIKDKGRSPSKEEFKQLKDALDMFSIKGIEELATVRLLKKDIEDVFEKQKSKNNNLGQMSFLEREMQRSASTGQCR